MLWVPGVLILTLVVQRGSSRSPQQRGDVQSSHNHPQGGPGQQKSETPQTDPHFLPAHNLMSRLASLKGPSSPSPNPAKGQKARQSPAKSPNSKRDSPGPSIYDRLEPDTSSPSESTYHRKLRSILLDIRGVVKTWNDLVLVDGLKAAKALVDARTELE